jgi:hypothetical protein
VPARDGDGLHGGGHAGDGDVEEALGELLGRDRAARLARHLGGEIGEALRDGVAIESRSNPDLASLGFGTLELTGPDERGWRTVAVRVERQEWQLTRYDRWEALLMADAAPARSA